MKNWTLLFALVALAACRQEPLPQDPPFVPIDYTVLPPATQEGKNTFGCKVNGEVWVPRVELFVPWYEKAVSFNEKNGTGTGIISCRLLNESIDDFFTIAFGRNYLQPTHYITVSPSVSEQWFSPNFRQGVKYYEYIDSDTANYFKITAIDTSKNFISGIFQFTLYNPNKTTSLKITEGRFDLLYYPK